MKINATILQLSENINGENPSKVAQGAENIGINLHEDFKRLLWPINTQTLYPKSSDGHLNRKNSYTFWKTIESSRPILEENSDHNQGVIKFQRNLIKRRINQVKSGTKFSKPLDLDHVNTSLTFCSYSDHTHEFHQVQKI